MLNSLGGRINKYMGDGFLASWRDGAAAPAEVSASLTGFRNLQSRAHLVFRMVIHRGVVAVGGAPTLGEESLMSSDLSFAFRIEKLAGSLGLPFLLSPAAAPRSRPILPCYPFRGATTSRAFRRWKVWRQFRRWTIPQVEKMRSQGVIR